MTEQVPIGQYTSENRETSEQGTVRLKHLAQINPIKSEISNLDLDTKISFVPLEYFGTDGEIKNTEERPLGDVYDGYTYFQEGDIAIAKITPSFENGKGAICRGLTNGIGFGTTELHILRPREGISTQFLWYVLRSKPFMDEAETAMRGVAGQQRIPTEFLENYEASIFEKKRQETISSYLSSWDEKISETIGEVEEISSRIRSRRISMITTEVTTSPQNSELVDSESKWFKQLPHNWETIRLKFLLDDLEQGWSPQCNEVPSSPNEWGVLKTGCVNKITFDSRENKVLPKDLNPRPELEVQGGDVIISRANASNLVGSCAIARDPDPKLMLSDKLYRLKWDQSICLPEYLVYALNSSFAREQIDLDSTGFSDSMVNISQKTISDIQIPLPPIKEQKMIVSSLNQNISRNNELQSNASLLIELLEEKRRALITAAVTGQIDVSDE